MLLQPRQRTFLAVWCIPVRARGSIAAEWAVSCIHLKSNNAGVNVVCTCEKELLACDKFDAHVYGHQLVIIETDKTPGANFHKTPGISSKAPENNAFEDPEIQFACEFTRELENVQTIAFGCQ